MVYKFIVFFKSVLAKSIVQHHRLLLRQIRWCKGCALGGARLWWSSYFRAAIFFSAKIAAGFYISNWNDFSLWGVVGPCSNIALKCPPDSDHDKNLGWHSACRHCAGFVSGSQQQPRQRPFHPKERRTLHPRRGDHKSVCRCGKIRTPIPAETRCQGTMLFAVIFCLLDKKSS